MSLSPKKYDVFISFRGDDTRTTFTSHLHQALCERNIISYIDYNLKKGDEVGPALAQAIENSHIALVVFSENYADSKWCLDELLKILECRKYHGQVVIPVFYQIDPSHVRKQKGGYERAFAKYDRELRNNKSHQDKVSEWKDALTKAANISGWDSRTHRDDSQVIDNIVEDVSKKLSLMYPSELENLVEIDEKSNCVELLLKTVPRIGIWGMGGVGKTTIAWHIFSKHFAQYDHVCFLKRVREESEKLGLEFVRNKLLAELLKPQITASEQYGSTFTKRRLSGKKVFIVLDDVDNAMQLEYLCGDLDDLGPNSRLIITTRDKHTLSGRVNEIYEVTEWKVKESLKLLSLGAFKQTHPKEGYKDLSERAVAYAGGNPLALKVLGSYFHTRSIRFWESELNDWESNERSLDHIKKVLKVSYKGLPRRQQEMFLDIAFFFKGEDKDFITRILDAFGFNATSGLEILEDKALVTISNDNKIQMHDLLQRMAFDIVREESRDPERRSRLKDAKEIRDILENNKGTSAIEGIIFDLSQKVDLHVRAETFNLMTKLRFLKFYIPPGKKRLSTMYHPEVMKPFFDKLAYLEWNGYPLKSLPQPFRAEQLVEIRLPHSNVEHLWYGMQELVNLEAIDLSECTQLVNLPDLTGALKLKWMRLSGCESLCEVQASAFSKDTLHTLLLDRCTKLQSLVGEKHLTSLKRFSVNGCSSLKEFSLSSDLIRRLDLSKTGIEILHPSIGGMTNLDWLNLEGLRLQNLPNELSCLRSLTQLRLSHCSVVTKSKLEALFDGLKSLTMLYLKYCCNLFELPDNISSLSSLYELRLDGSSVERLPTSIKHLSELEIQSLDNCCMLSCLPELAPNIKEFHANNCTALVSVSTLKTFSISMVGKKKYISFKNNGLMLELDEPSLKRIMEDVILIMKSAALHNILVRKYRFQTHSYNYNSAVVCLPGSGVPRKLFKHLTTMDSSTVTVNISNSLGFIFAVVISPSNETKQHGRNAITCHCYSEDGRKVGNRSWCPHQATTNLNMEHVFVWYDPYHSDSILSCDNSNILFEFCVTTYTAGSRGKQIDGLVSIKECGICPIYYSEVPGILGSMILDNDLKSELYDAIQFEIGSVENFEEMEGSGIELIEIVGDDHEKERIGTCSQTKYDCLIVSKGTQAYDNPQEKENWDDDDNSTETKKFKTLLQSSRKSQEEIVTSSPKQEQLRKEDSTGGPDDAESSFKMATMKLKSKVNEGTLCEADAELHLSIIGSSEDHNDIQDNSEEIKHLQENPNPSVDFGKPKGDEDGSSDEDPFAEVENILLGSLKCPAKQTYSTSNVAIRESLHNLQCLLKNSLEAILGNIELQQQLHMCLECIKQASHEDVSPNVAKLVKSMTTSSIEDLFKDFTLTKEVVEDHITRLQQREKLLQQVRDAKKRKESVKREKSLCEDEAGRLEERVKILDEKIRILVEEKKSIELEKAKMKEKMERCDREKRELVDEAENMIIESKELVSVIKDSSSSYDAALLKQQKLNDKWESFRTAFADNWGN